MSLLDSFSALSLLVLHHMKSSVFINLQYLNSDLGHRPRVHCDHVCQVLSSLISKRESSPSVQRIDLFIFRGALLLVASQQVND
jgi:hypothetical protein